jgi:hypothetical protein
MHDKQRRNDANLNGHAPDALRSLLHTRGHALCSRHWHQAAIPQVAQ